MCLRKRVACIAFLSGRTTAARKLERCKRMASCRAHQWGIEWVKVAQVRERPVGTFVWAMVDFITARTVDVGRAPLSPAAPVPGEEPQDYVVSP